jgi:hypothetical protein
LWVVGTLRGGEGCVGALGWGMRMDGEGVETERESMRGVESVV